MTDGGEVANTVRAWVLGMIFVTLGSGLNMFLSMRYMRSRIVASFEQVANLGNLEIRLSISQPLWSNCEYEMTKSLGS